MDKKGFTLLELLIVVAIIGLLASISWVSLGGARKKAVAIRTISDVENIFTAMAFELKKEGREVWWTEAELGLGSDPAVENIPGLTEFLPRIPKPFFPGVDSYRYDNDGDILGDNEAEAKGVNIIAYFSNDAERDDYFSLLDKTADQSTGPARGLVRTASPSAIFFNISPDPSKFGF